MFYALITRGFSETTNKCAGRILRMDGSPSEPTASSEQMRGRGNCDFDTSWAWGNGGRWGAYEVLPNLTEAAFNAHWGIKEEPKSSLPAEVEQAIEQGDFGCKKDSVRKLVAAILKGVSRG